MSGQGQGQGQGRSEGCCRGGGPSGVWSGRTQSAHDQAAMTSAKGRVNGPQHVGNSGSSSVFGTF